MPLPPFEASGDLPAGRHVATLAEVVQRFGGGGPKRTAATKTLERICELAKSTGNLDFIVVFGSFVSATAEPNDIDVILVMTDDFRREECNPAASPLFDHESADAMFGASVFWVRPTMLLGEPLEHFLAFWQNKRDQSQRGIVEIRP